MERGRLAWRDPEGLVVEADDGAILALVAVTEGADFTKAVGVGWMEFDVFEIRWFQHSKEGRGHVEGVCEEIPDVPLLGPGRG